MSLPSKELSDTALDALIARERTRVVAPLTEWRALSAQLRAEGLLHAHGEVSEQSFDKDVPVLPPSRPRFVQWGRRLLVSVALVGVGVVGGRGLTVGQDIAPAIGRVIAGVSDSAMTFSSPTDALVVLERSQRQYQQAATYIAAHDTLAQVTGDAAMYKERLAALDEIMETTLTQLKATPRDPVLNQYYQSTAGARRATLRRLGKVLPAGVQVASY